MEIPRLSVRMWFEETHWCCDVFPLKNLKKKRETLRILGK